MSVASRVVAVVMPVALLAGCASGSVVVRQSTAWPRVSKQVEFIPVPPPLASPSPGAGSCRGVGEAFALSLDAAYRGALDPITAAQRFAKSATTPWPLSPESVWILANPSLVSTGQATLISHDAEVHALRLANGTWAIDSGERCR
jgi:hypothetical protein